MRIEDLISMAIRNLWTRKLRTFLTILGVVIGCASIVVMVSLGYGIAESSKSFIESMGNLNDVTIHGKRNDRTGQNETLTSNHITEMSKIPNVEKVFGLLGTSSNNVYFRIRAARRYEGHGEIIGIDPIYMEDYGLKLADGRFPHGNEEFVAVYGSQVKNQFGRVTGNNWRPYEVNFARDKIEMFNTEYDPITGQEKNSVTYELKYGGELEESQNWATSSAIFLPIENVRKILIAENDKKPANERDKNIKNKYSRLILRVNEIENVKAIKDALTEQGYQAEAMTDWLDNVQNDLKTQQAIFGGIGAVSLLVAAIGISNTMVMSIFERTKEIGIMKVIGASIRDIRKLFLLEAILIGFLGGALGLALSYGISSLLNNFLGGSLGMGMAMGSTKISIIPIHLSLLALLFTSFIGLISGYFPARRAMSISALDAMRSE
jgi:putative ABC transport system permease protein